MDDAEFFRALIDVLAEGRVDPTRLGFAVAVEPAHERAGQGRMAGQVVRMESWSPFEAGEVIVIHGDDEYGVDGREPFNEGRNPDKWDVRFEWFGRDIEAARRRSAEVESQYAT